MHLVKVKNHISTITEMLRLACNGIESKPTLRSFEHVRNVNNILYVHMAILEFFLGSKQNKTIFVSTKIPKLT